MGTQMTQMKQILADLFIQYNNLWLSVISASSVRHRI